MTHQVCLYRPDTLVSTGTDGTEFYNLYLQQIDVDFTFSCANNELVKAHRIILMASSNFFYEEFKNNREYLNCILPQVSADSVRLFLELVYTKKVNATSEAINEVMKLADMFCLEYQEMEGGPVALDNDETKIENSVMENTTVTTEMQCDDNVDKSHEEDLTFVDEKSDTSEIIDVSEEVIENINNSDVKNDNQSTTEANYKHCLRTMNFSNLSSSCVICMKFYPDITQHIKKTHEFRRTPNWQCEECKSSFYWIDKKFHICK